MSSDSVDAILDDCTLSPGAYLSKWGLEVGDDPDDADCITSMCIHLVGRTISNMRDPRRLRGSARPGSFAAAIEALREFRWQHATNDEEAIPYINAVEDAHVHEVVKAVAHAYASGYDVGVTDVPVHCPKGEDGRGRDSFKAIIGDAVARVLDRCHVRNPDYIDTSDLVSRCERLSGTGAAR